jgi:hypothetical protein
MAEDLLTPSNTLVKVRWQEPYVSEGLNKKLNGLVPHGVIRGGRIGTSALDSTVVVEADDDTGDSIYSVVDANGHQLTFRQVGNVNLDLDVGTLPGTTAYIGLDVTYSTTAATVVRWRGYSAAEIDADPTIVCLGSADVPAVAAVIPAGDIYGDRRTDGGLNVSTGMREWQQLVNNPSFEGHEVSVSGFSVSEEFPYWTLEPGGNGTWHVLTPTSTPVADPRVGQNNLAFEGAGAGAEAPYAYYDRSTRVAPGQMVRVSAWVRGDSVTMGSGASAKVGVEFIIYDWDGTAISTVEIIEDGTTITGTFDYIEIAETLKMPADAAFVGYSLFIDDVTSVTGTIGFDDFRVWIEPGPVGSLYDQRTDVVGPEVNTTKMVVSPYLGLSGVTDPSVLAERSLSMICANASASSLRFDLDTVKAAVTSWLLRMSKGGVQIGSSLVSTAAEGIIARLSTNIPVFSNARYVLLWEMPNLGSAMDIRLYATDQTNVTNPLVSSRTAEAFVITVNAEWDGSQWAYDSSGSAAQRFEFGLNGLYFSQKESGGTSPWDDTDWEDNTEAYRYFGVQRGADGIARLTANDAYFEILGATNSGSNPTSGATPKKNTLYAKTIVKGWRTFNLSGGSASGGDGVNINLSTVGTDMSFTFSQAMADGLYCVTSGIVGSSSAGYIVPVAKNIALGGFDLQFFALVDSGDTITHTAATAITGSFAIAVHGRQA